MSVRLDLAEFEANSDTLRAIVETQCDAVTPILMASTPGNEPSAKIVLLGLSKDDERANKIERDHRRV